MLTGSTSTQLGQCTSYIITTQQAYMLMPSMSMATLEKTRMIPTKTPDWLAAPLPAVAAADAPAPAPAPAPEPVALPLVATLRDRTARGMTDSERAVDPMEVVRSSRPASLPLSASSASASSSASAGVAITAPATGSSAFCCWSSTPTSSSLAVAAAGLVSAMV